MKRVILCYLITAVVIAASAAGETVRALTDESDVLAIVSGFHAFRDKDRNFEVRLLEANGGATVAKNAISLYLVVTNNSSAGDLQEKVWRLPVKVSAIRNVRLGQSGLLIMATQELADESIERRDIAIKVSYHVTGSLLDDRLEVDRN